MLLRSVDGSQPAVFAEGMKHFPPLRLQVVDDTFASSVSVTNHASVANSENVASNASVSNNPNITTSVKEAMGVDREARRLRGSAIIDDLIELAYGDMRVAWSICDSRWRSATSSPATSRSCSAGSART